MCKAELRKAIRAALRTGLKKYSSKDHEKEMALRQLKSISELSQELHQMLENQDPDIDIMAWVQAKLTKAEDYVSSAHSYMSNQLNPDLDKE